MTSKNCAWLVGMLLAAAVSTSITACGGGATTFQPPPAITVSVSAASLMVSPGGTDTITAVVSNDTANRGVMWTVACSAAPCGSVSPASTASGSATTYTAPAAPPASGVTVTITASSVSDGTISSLATITAPGVLMISTVSLSDGTVGAAYSETIQATGGGAPFRWSLWLLRGGNLPAGLTLVPSSGNSVTISGTPTTVQNATCSIRVIDATGQTATQLYSVTIKSTVAQTQSGAVQGVLQGDELAFRGIPYAAPPVGNLRWQPPQPPQTWTGTRDASTFGNICPQPDANNQPIGDEDCLFLNIFKSTQTPHNQPQAVMVFIHGGSNRQGSTQGPRSDAPPLATQGVILVTIQYRLGMLGFLVHPLLDAEGGGASGNYGLMDQIAALNWVHNNIASFGGDPARVMVFGVSAGSFDIEALLVSPLSKGLFSTAGMESGALVHGQYLALSAMEPLEAPLVQAVGCNNATDVLACLRGVPANTVVANTGAIPTIPGDDRCRSVVIEPRALPVDPFDALQQNGTPVPLLIGSTREEESAQGANDDPTAMPPLTEAGYEAALHADFDPVGAGVATQVLALYPASSYDAPVYALIAAESDYFDITPTRNVARAAAKANGPPVWRYLYTHTLENDPNLSPFRAFHTSETFFVFGNPSITPFGPHTPTAAELTFAMQMMGYWSQFAKTGNPNAPGSTLWPRYDGSTDAMLQLDDTQTAINGYHNMQCDYFSTLLP